MEKLDLQSGAPIGLFDFGIGGLTVVKEIRKEMPFENIIFLEDKIPLGKSIKEIEKLVISNVIFLKRKGVKLIIIACNTATAAGLDEAKKTVNIPIIGVIEPGAKMAVATTKKGKIEVVGTDTTVHSKLYSKYIRSLVTRYIEVFEFPCPELATQIEEYLISGYEEFVKNIVKQSFKFFKSKDIDTLIMGCTHFPLIKELFKKIFGEINYIDPAIATARVAKRILISNKIVNNSRKKASYNFYTKNVPKRLELLAEKILSNYVQCINVLPLSDI